MKLEEILEEFYGNFQDPDGIEIEELAEVIRDYYVKMFIKESQEYPDIPRYAFEKHIYETLLST